MVRYLLDMSNFLKVAIRAAKDAGEILKEGFAQSRGKGVFYEKKQDNSLVTDFDKRAEERVIQSIQSHFPNHAILAEESGGEVGDGYTWLIDPLDGTSNFVMGNPLFSTVISLLYQREVELCVVFCPILGELYNAERKRKDVYLNDKPIHVSTRAPLRAGTFTFAKGRTAEAFSELYRLFGKIAGNARTYRIFGSVAFEACQVAAGRIEGQINVGGSLWDKAGPAFLIEHAGGRVTNLEGGESSYSDLVILATNGVIHDEVLEVIKR